jgi:uncharacterized protein
VTRYQNATVDGLNVFYREAGPNGGPAIVLLHGFPSSSDMFRELIVLLAGHPEGIEGTVVQNGNVQNGNAYVEGIGAAFQPPFTMESALRKVQMAEDPWNSRDPERVSMAYSEDSEWRNRTDFIRGRDQIRAFLQRKWAKELDYKLKKTLWGFRENRIAVSFEYEWHDESGQWFRSYGNELWEFNEEGLMQKRLASINDAAIAYSERRIL